MNNIIKLNQVKQENIALNILNEQLELLETFDWNCNETNIAAKIVKETIDLLDEDRIEFLEYYERALELYHESEYAMQIAA